MRVLVAEDDAVSRLILRRAVEKLGHECLTAEDGEKAWQTYKENPDLDVVISDWMMPGVDGLELCHRIRAEERHGYTYFIFLTALGDKEHLLMGFEAGADDYLSKPLDREELQVRLISAHRLTTLHHQLDEQRMELERLNTQLADQARTDALTGLSNRLRMQEDLASLDARKERYGQTYCVVLCDIDFFKPYNDTYGHPAGDEILRRVAGAIKSHCRSGDTAYRYGGEEFLAVLPEQTRESGLRVAERLRQAIEGLKIPHGSRKAPEIVTISVGIAATSERDGKDAEATLQEADEALYEAKKLGRNQVRPQPEREER
ncbi:MAG: diguanylate cyclase [Rubrobacteraceae bacterium]